jgi:tetratricopeptide (TPR) repeat protein
MLAEETVVTRAAADRAANISGPMPTVEVPFPEAVEPPPLADLGTSTNPVKSGAAPAAAPVAPVAAKSAPRVPVAKQLRTTLTNVRTLPLWRRRIAPPLFFGIVGLLVLLFFGGIAIARGMASKAPDFDMRLSAQELHQKQLRRDGTALLMANRVPEAYAKFSELQRLAPKSPYVQKTMAHLNAMRQQEELSKQQLAQAKAKFDEGVLLYNDRKYVDAVARFNEALAINPADASAIEYVKLAQQQEEQRLAAKAAKRANQQQTAAATVTAHETASTTSASTQTTAPPSSTTQLTTIFTHPFVDGRIVVRAGADIVANEKLFDEKPARFLRRASKTPRPINVTNQFPAKNADVSIWVTVPMLNIQEHHVMPSVRFAAGGQHRLVVRYDAAAKKFSYEIN